MLSSCYVASTALVLLSNICPCDDVNIPGFRTKNHCVNTVQWGEGYSTGLWYLSEFFYFICCVSGSRNGA